ncbi:YDG/SRA domain-containing protein [Streptomyces sp. NPDC046876]|uniref:YDG/SRA domain-containing protein n=1 Tax=Streptomyces sp. NPDC046876 TaxID=3155616 RepID=UPI0034022F69
MTAERVVGHVEGIELGSVHRRRQNVFDARLHGDTQRGISKLKDADGEYVSDAIVLNGGYHDDDDNWHEIRYTGASPGSQKHPVTKDLLASQSWDYADNAALKRSFERGYPVRILRGAKGDERYSPNDGYRYDGLYRITEARTAISVTPGPGGEPIEICQFILVRCPEQDEQHELTTAERAVADLVAFTDEEKFPQTRTAQIQRMVRDTAAARRIKDLYDGQCQTCGIRLVGANAKPYSQGAHLKPLAAPHKGPDVERNILCLCPNCHVRLDIGAISLDEDWSVIERIPDGASRTTLPRLTLHKNHGLHQAYAAYQREWWNNFHRSRGGA